MRAPSPGPAVMAGRHWRESGSEADLLQPPHRTSAGPPRTQHDLRCPAVPGSWTEQPRLSLKSPAEAGLDVAVPQRGTWQCEAGAWPD